MPMKFLYRKCVLCSRISVKHVNTIRPYRRKKKERKLCKTIITRLEPPPTSTPTSIVSSHRGGVNVPMSMITRRRKSRETTKTAGQHRRPADRRIRTLSRDTVYTIQLRCISCFPHVFFSVTHKFVELRLAIEKGRLDKHVPWWHGHWTHCDPHRTILITILYGSALPTFNPNSDEIGSYGPRKMAIITLENQPYDIPVATRTDARPTWHRPTTQNIFYSTFILTWLFLHFYITTSE